MLRTTIHLLIALLLIPSLSYALTGKVISVADGNTITVLDSSNRQHKILPYGIDTPEKKQAFGKAAKMYTQAWLQERRPRLLHTILTGMEGL